MALILFFPRPPEQPNVVCNATKEHLSFTSVGSRTVTKSWRAKKV